MTNMTETDSDITRDDRDEIVITRSSRRERERAGAIGLAWLLGVVLIGWRGLGRMPAGLVPLAWPFPHSSPHPPLPQSHPSPLSTSI